MRVSVTFEYPLADEPRYEVEASVHLGNTPARGDNPDAVEWLSIYGMDGETARVPDEIYQAMEEEAIIAARNVGRYIRGY